MLKLASYVGIEIEEKFAIGDCKIESDRGNQEDCQNPSGLQTESRFKSIVFSNLRVNKVGEEQGQIEI